MLHQICAKLITGLKKHSSLNKQKSLNDYQYTQDLTVFNDFPNYHYILLIYMFQLNELLSE